MPLPLTLAPFPWLDLLVILLLVTLNGLLSMSELAIVSARRSALSW
jgi:putative hemolysin